MGSFLREQDLEKEDVMNRRSRQNVDRHQPVYAIPLEVRPRPGENMERTIRRFTKKVRNDGILQEVMQKSYFEKPSVRRRRKSARARYLAKREAEKN
jgi:small subunit ribosomal protein S21